MKSTTLIACFICIMFRNVAFAQDELRIAEQKDSKRDTKTVTILSMSGKSRKVHIMPDYPNHVLYISCLKDTITIDDFWGVPVEVHVLGNRFVQINYEVRGGTGFALGNMMLLSVRNNKLYESMCVLRYTHSEDGLGDYKIKIALVGSNAKNYKLNVKVHDDFRSKSQHEKNYSYNGQTVLNFDTVQNVFYQFKQPLFNKHIVNYVTKVGNPKDVLDGYYPTIILGTETYYFVKGKWVVPSEIGELNYFQ